MICLRLWHKDLIPYLPRQQLLGQWRECCCIARSIAVNGTPNHVLVNKIMDYPLGHFNTYSVLICTELINRGYNCNWDKYDKWCTNKSIAPQKILFNDWHNDRYFWQCYYNLQEKYDCGAITDEEWDFIERGARSKENA